MASKNHNLLSCMSIVFKENLGPCKLEESGIVLSTYLSEKKWHIPIFIQACNFESLGEKEWSWTYTNNLWRELVYDYNIDKPHIILYNEPIRPQTINMWSQLTLRGEGAGDQMYNQNEQA